jgi:hypothetical protein
MTNKSVKFILFIFDIRSYFQLNVVRSTGFRCILIGRHSYSFTFDVTIFDEIYIR